MSNKDLDNLFKNKLEDFGKTPAANLWDKIDEQIERPRKKKAWIFLSVAASLLVLIIFKTVFLEKDNSIPVQIAKTLVANDDDCINIFAEEKTSVATNVVKKSEQVTPLKNNKIDVTHTKPQQAQLPKLSNTINIQPSIAQNNEVEQNEKIDSKDIIQEVNINVSELENIADNKTTDATNVVPSTSNHKGTNNGQTLVFDISQFEAQKTEIVANEDDKKESKLKRILKIAKDIKEGESGMGDIREAKNELLAFNLKKGK
jgi:hypothetical protein